MGRGCELAISLAAVLAGCDPSHGLPPLEAVARAYHAWRDSGPFSVGYMCGVAFRQAVSELQAGAGGWSAWGGAAS